jgi:branched-chain amino acid transport system ATP-binding protein
MLKIEQLNSKYGDLHTLWDIDLDVNQGEIMTVVGSNGAGKSTILKNVSGLIAPSSGRMLFEGEDVTSLPAHEKVKRGIVLVPEGRRIFPEMTVLENLYMGSYLPEARKKRNESIERVFHLFPRLKERINQNGGTMSGGEQQMLAIGRGLVALPRLLMLDEPSLGLSPLMVKNIFEIIQTINSQGVTILLVEQNVNQSLRISKRACVLETGRIVMSGTGSELLGNENVRKAFLGM